jgi:DNA repair protein RadD
MSASKIIPRDYQEQLMELVRIAIRMGRRRPIVVAATGSGKTVIFSSIANSAASRGKRVLILAHRDTLIKQASNKLRDYGVHHGIIMAGFTPSPHAKVQVGSVQTLVRRLEKMALNAKLAADRAYAEAIAGGATVEQAEAAALAAKKAKGFDLIIIDEAHLSAAKSYLEIINFFSDAIVIGFTGSPCRLDGKPLGAESGGIYDELIQAIAPSELIRRGFLVRPVVYAPSEQLDLSGIKKTMGDYDTKALAEVVDKPKLIGDAVAQYRRICDGVPAVAWCVTIDHARHVAAEFNANGIPAEMLCGDDDTPRREAVLKKLATGEVKVVTFVGILVEGVDCPAIGAVILLRPTMSLASYLQVIGRGLRPFVFANGVKKEVCYVIDHAGLTFKHGFADEDREWELNGEVKRGKKKKKDDEPTLPITQCTKCYACFKPTDAVEAGKRKAESVQGYSGAPCCPHCQEPIAVKVRKVEHVDGDLHEITREMAEVMRKDKRQEVGQAKSLDDLRRIEAERGYKRGWAEKTWEAKNRKKAPPRPPEPSMDELKAMTLSQLENVANQQGWPIQWASTFFHQHRGKAA